MSVFNPQTLPQFLTWTAPPRHDVIGYGVAPEGSVMFIYGEYDTKKSWTAMEAGWAISEGVPWLGYPTYQKKVLLWDAELTPGQSQERWLAFARTRVINTDKLHIAAGVDVKLDGFIGLTELTAAIIDYQYEVVIIDNLYSVMAGDLTTNVAASLFIDNCKKLRAAFPTLVFIIIHHAHQPFIDARTHRQIKQRAYEMFGSSFFTNWADTIIEVSDAEQDTGIPNSVTFTPQKKRLSPFILPTMQFQFELATTQFRLI